MAIYIPSCGGGDCGSGDPCATTTGSKEQIKSYSYHDSIPAGKDWIECPNVGSCDGVTAGSCSNQSITGYIYSDSFQFSLTGKTVTATILGGSQIDNFGAVGGVIFPNPNGCQGIAMLENDTKVIPEIEGNKLKLSFVATNSIAGGPYGLLNVGVHWQVI